MSLFKVVSYTATSVLHSMLLSQNSLFLRSDLRCKNTPEEHIGAQFSEYDTLIIPERLWVCNVESISFNSLLYLVFVVGGGFFLFLL
jgi:hypothetical protein